MPLLYVYVCAPYVYCPFLLLLLLSDDVGPGQSYLISVRIPRSKETERKKEGRDRTDERQERLVAAYTTSLLL